MLDPFNDVVFIFHADGLVIGSITLLFRAGQPLLIDLSPNLPPLRLVVGSDFRSVL